MSDKFGVSPAWPAPETANSAVPVEVPSDTHRPVCPFVSVPENSSLPLVTVRFAGLRPALGRLRFVESTSNTGSTEVPADVPSETQSLLTPVASRPEK